MYLLLCSVVVLEDRVATVACIALHMPTSLKHSVKSVI